MCSLELLPFVGLEQHCNYHATVNINFESSVASSLSLIDLVSLQFALVYHQYVLYSSDEGEDEPTKYNPDSIIPSRQYIQLVEISVLDAEVRVPSSLLSRDTDLP